MTLLLPNLAPPTSRSGGIKDPPTRSAVQQLEAWAAMLTARLAKMEATATSVGGVPTTRLINTTAPLTGGGDLSADRTLAINLVTDTVKGAVPPPNTGGTANTFLRDDLTWADISSTLTSPFYGTGVDGALTFDGTSAVSLTAAGFSATTTLTPSSNVYTLTRDIYASSITINSGVKIKTAGYRIFCTGTLTNNGTIHNDGASATTDAGASGAAAGTLPGGKNGAAGIIGTGSGNSAATSSGCYSNPWTTTQTGSAGGSSGSVSGTAGKDRFQGGGGGGVTSSDQGTAAGGTGGPITAYTVAQPVDIVSMVVFGGPYHNDLGSLYTGASGGGGGAATKFGGTGTDPVSGGGGGGGGGLYVGAKTFAGTGAIHCNGGNGANGVKGDGNSSAAGGGGGGGGYVVVLYSSSTGSQTVTATGGTGGTGQGGGGFTASSGGNGAAGWTHVYRIQGSGAGGSGGLTDGDYGDITVSGLGTVMTIDASAVTTTKIANDAVTYDKLQNVSATDRFLGRKTAGAGNAEELTGTEATARLDTFTASAKGLVPAPGGSPTGTTALLDNGTWGAVSGGGGGAPAFSGVSVSNSGALSSTSATGLLLTYDTEAYDTDAYHSTASNTSRLTAPSAGYYLITASCEFATNGTNNRLIRVYKNAGGSFGSGTLLLEQRKVPQSTGSFVTTCEVEGVHFLAAGDYVEAFAYQDSGSSLNVSCQAYHAFEMTKVGGANGTAPMAASVYNSSNLSLTTATWTLVTWDTEHYDTGSLHSTSSNTSRLTAPATGYYQVRASIEFAASSSGRRMLNIRQNAAGSSSGGTGVAFYFGPPPSTGASIVNLSRTVFLTAGDYVELFAQQDTGGNLNITHGSAGASYFEMTLLSGTPAPTFSGAAVHNNNSAISVANDTLTALTFSTEVYDTDAYHSTASNTSRFTAPTAGYYRVTATAEFAANGTGYRQVGWQLNGTTTFVFARNPASSGSAATVLQCTGTIYMTAGDYVEVLARQDSGGNLNVTTREGSRCMIERLGF